MPNRGQQLGKRRPFVRRPGIGKFPPWDGMNREGDAAACPGNAFRMLINTRTDDSEIWCRGGQRSINPDDELDGCIGGVFPPEFEPPDEVFSRLLIAEGVSGVPDSAETYIYAPDELEEGDADAPVILTPGFHNGVNGLLWNGQRLLALWQYQSDVLGAGITEYVLTRVDGSTAMAENANGIALEWEGNVGGVVRVDQDYYASRYDSDVVATDSVRLEKIEFISGTFDFTNEQANSDADTAAPSPSTFLTSAVDGRVIWLNKSTSVAELTIRSTSAGTYSQVTFPVGFTPIDTSMQAWAWHAAKLYIGGALSGDLAICAYDPVLNTISTVRTISATNPDHCPMAVHKGVLYFGYGNDATGAERIGQLKAGVWTDQIAAFPAPADIFALCSFRGHIYMTKDDFLLRCENPSVDPTFETFYEATTGFTLGAMVAVP